MAYSVIKKPSDYFNTKLWTGNDNSGHAITGVGFQPDFVWIKNRNTTDDHNLFDSVRGNTKIVLSNSTSAEATNGSRLESFDSDGITVGADNDTNRNGDSIVGWNWLANGTGSANTDGSISSTVSANTTSGFSIVSYTGTGANATVGHGLGSIPKMIIVKRTSGADPWRVQHTSLGSQYHLILNETNASSTGTNVWNDTEPTSSVFTISTDRAVNGSGDTFIAYCFAEKQGFSKFGSYTGNGNADGTFVYTGFSPAFVMVKRTDSANSWNIKDNRRNNASTSFNINPRNATLLPNDSAADQDANALDFLSNGFKNKSTGNDVNASGGSYIYMAFAEQPLVGDNPATAR